MWGDEGIKRKGGAICPSLLNDGFVDVFYTATN